MRLQGKTALITGASEGMGRAFAVAFAREGARVALMARNAERLKTLADEISASHGTDSVIALSGDISRREDIERVVAATIERFGALNVLVNNAGILLAGTAASITEEEWDKTFDVNVKGLWLLSRAVLPHMRRSGGGSIINLSSILGLVGARNRAAYAASKGAVTLLTKAMALDHAADGIRVNCICPASVETEMTSSYIRNAPDPAAMRAERIALHPIGRLGKPEDIVGCAIFLASDESSWITGAAFPIDGGYTAG